MWLELARRASSAALALWMIAPSVWGLELNRATRAELERLDGVGVSMAERLLRERERVPFAGWDDLQRRVKGMRGNRVQQLQRQGVTIDGVALEPAQKKEVR